MGHHVGTLWARSGLALTVVRRLCRKVEPRIEQARRWVTKPGSTDWPGRLVCKALERPWMGGLAGRGVRGAGGR